jgi:Kef-type K+ transport system membrane component KefB/mannitol/fructose-specific phosphotransferase system IIA component (Ntr-type)
MLQEPVSDPVLIFAITMVIVLVAPLLVVRLRIPGLVGLILAGAIAGPSVLGLLERDDTFELLGTVGLLYLMFVAGVSLDLAKFAKLRGLSIGFGTASFVVPQMLALVVGMKLLGFGLPESLLLGSIVGSHTLLAYPIVDRLGIAENRGMVMAMGATIVTDLLSLVILAIVVASVAGDTTVGFWVQFVGVVAIWAAAVIVLLPRLGTWFFRNVRQGPALDFGFLMVALFVTAWLAGVVGLAPIIGAFMAGLLMNRLVPPQSPLMTRIKFVGDALLIPFFLISVGLLIDVRVLFSSLSLWGLALVFTALVVVGKTIAAKGTQLVVKQSASEGWTVAGLTIPQAAATLAVTLVGFEIGLFSEVIVNAVVVMILLTSLLGPSLVEKFGRQVALEEERKPTDPADAPQRILVPLANPETAGALMDVALSIRDKDGGQPVYPLTVAREGVGEEAAVAASEKLLGHAVVHAASADVPVVPLTRVDHNIARGIMRAVRERRISTVVIGWNGESTARAMVFGSVLDQFLEESRAMVFVNRLIHPLAATQRVVLLVPPYIQREQGFASALAAIKTMTARSGANLVVLAVERAVPEVEEWIKRTDPEVSYKVIPVPTWSELISMLEGRVRELDLVCLLSVRRGTLAWRPSLMRTPSIIARQYPEHDFITVYLSEEVTERLAAAPSTSRDEEIPELPLDHVSVGLDNGSVEEVFTELITRATHEQPGLRDRVVRALSSYHGDYAPELSPGIAFYHLHTDEVEDRHLFLGVSRHGVSLPQTSQPAHVVILLLVPARMNAETYLKELALTAHLVHREGLVESLRGASTAEEARAILLGQMQAPSETPA